MTNWCQPEPHEPSGKCFCPVCDPEGEFPFSCHSKRNCGAVKTIRRRGTNPPQPPGRKYLGDHVHDALAAVGITEERVSRWLGRPCGCGQKQKWLNRMHRWAENWVKGLFGSKKEAAAALESEMGDCDGE